MKRIAWILGFGFFTVVGLAAQSLNWEGASWDSQGDVRQQEFAGRPALRIGTGKVVRRDVAFQDGTIEFDLALSDHRSFAYILFRMQDDHEYEELYLRAHKSRLPDTIQYSPVFRGVSNWQLYHGPESTAEAILPHQQWLPVRLVLKGSNLALFVGNVSRPQLVNRHLVRAPAAGFIAFRSFVAEQADADSAFAMFSNLRLHPGRFDYDFGEAPSQPPVDPGLVQKWDVSGSFLAPETPVSQLPARVLAGEWETLPADRDGLLVLSRYRDKPGGEGIPALLVRLRIESSSARTVPFDFGFSDTVTLFVNGEPILAGNDSYSFNFPRRQGLIGLDQGTAFLHLRQGTNELILAITETFGGWGVMGRFPNREGIRIHP